MSASSSSVRAADISGCVFLEVLEVRKRSDGLVASALPEPDSAWPRLLTGSLTPFQVPGLATETTTRADTAPQKPVP